MIENLRVNIGGLLIDEESDSRIPREGQGVFEYASGMICLDTVRLRSVWKEPEEAETEADRLREAEGVLEFEIDSDPESNIYREVTFFTGRVVLSDTPLEVSAVATYERVQPTG